MAFKGRKFEDIDFDSLQVTLVNSRLQQTNPALYIMLNQLILKLRQNKEQVNDFFNTIIGDITIDTSNNLQAILARILSFANAKLLTWDNEVASLINSKQLVAGDGILFDDTEPNTRVISSETAGAWLPMVTGAEPLEIMSNGAGDLLLIAYTP